MSFGENLKRLRLDARLTQLQLAELSDVGVAQLQRYETGAKFRPRELTLVKLAKALNCTVEDLGVEPALAGKPSRQDLLKVIGQLQNYIGEAMAANDNDRDPNHHARVYNPLKTGFDLCVQSRSFDPPC